MSADRFDYEFLKTLLPFVQEGLDKEVTKNRYFDDPALWAKEVLGLDLWEKQQDIATDIATGPKKSIAVRAGHGVGKSFLAGILACWWIDTRPIQFVFVASTAPSADQVSTILWREIRKFHALSHERHNEYKRLREAGKDTGTLPDHPLPGYITQQNKWMDDLGNVIGQGRKPPDHKEDAFQGIHAEYVLALGDEAVGLNANMIDSLSNITSNAKSRRLLIANPTNPNTRLGEIFSMKPNSEGVVAGEAWSKHHISVLDSPNFHGGGLCDCERHRGQPHGLGMSVQAMDSLTDQSYVEEKELEYGRNSARFKSRVLGEFAYDEGNVLFDAYTLAQAMDAECFIPEDFETVLGVDVGRSINGDSTYIYAFTTGVLYEWEEVRSEGADGTPIYDRVRGAVSDRVGGRLRYVDHFRGVPLVDRYEKTGEKTIGQATLIHQHAIELQAIEVRIDKGGLGVGLVDGLMGLNPAYDVIEMISGSASPNIHSWQNNRAFQYDQMRKRMAAGEIDIDPDDDFLIKQLEDILFESKDPYGQMLIESKDSMKKRGAKSPDAADAAWYACADLTFLRDPVRRMKKGEVVRLDPFQMLNLRRNAPGMPI